MIVGHYFWANLSLAIKRLSVSKLRHNNLKNNSNLGKRNALSEIYLFANSTKINIFVMTINNKAINVVLNNNNINYSNDFVSKSVREVIIIYCNSPVRGEEHYSIILILSHAR